MHGCTVRTSTRQVRATWRGKSRGGKAGEKGKEGRDGWEDRGLPPPPPPLPPCRRKRKGQRAVQLTTDLHILNSLEVIHNQVPSLHCAISCIVYLTNGEGRQGRVKYDMRITFTVNGSTLHLHPNYRAPQL